jgi:hypothetical protein
MFSTMILLGSKRVLFLDQIAKEVKMKIQVEFDEEDLRKAVIAYLKLNGKVCLPQNVYFRIEKEEGYADRIICTATVHSI